MFGSVAPTLTLLHTRSQPKYEFLHRPASTAKIGGTLSYIGMVRDGIFGFIL